MTKNTAVEPYRLSEDFWNLPIKTLHGTDTTLAEQRGKTLLIVNVASRCGLSPQYGVLEQLQEQYGPDRFSVLGFPSNQFLQELGSEEAISEYCSATWGVTFPMFEKVRLNGGKAHPIYQELKQATDESGKAGRVQWNFEKFLVTTDGKVHRFRPSVQPDDPEIVTLIQRDR